MGNESWVRTHQQRMLAEAFEGARRAALARQVTTERDARTSPARRVVLFAVRLVNRPRAAYASGPAAAKPAR